MGQAVSILRPCVNISGERQIVQIVGVISLFGFLNRWNDTVATQLESAPSEFAHGVLEASGLGARGNTRVNLVCGRFFIAAEAGGTDGHGSVRSHLSGV